MSLTSLEKYFRLMEERPNEFVNGDLKIIKDKKLLAEYETEKACDLGVLYESPYNILVKDLVTNGSKAFPYERIIKKNVDSNAVVIIPKFGDNFVLMKQFRHALRDYQICFPRGFGEPDISAEENAAKELCEELGCNIVSCSVIGDVVADSGLCGDKVKVCLCEITQPVCKYDYEGIKSIKTVSKDELINLIKSGKINDGYTISAFGMYILKKDLYLRSV